MINCSRLIRVFVIFVFIYFISARQTYAYLDPGTGSYFFQIIIASLLGMLFAIKIFWRKIKDSFTHLFSRKEKQNKHES